LIIEAKKIGADVIQPRDTYNESCLALTFFIRARTLFPVARATSAFVAFAIWAFAVATERLAALTSVAAFGLFVIHVILLGLMG
jgi:hypothetical protein